jgi:hypothetical protein
VDAVFQPIELIRESWRSPQVRDSQAGLWLQVVNLPGVGDDALASGHNR